MRFESYVYKHFNPQTGVCFYVGIGTGRNFERAYSSANRNRHWHNVVNKYGLPKVKFFAVRLTKEEACKIEIEQIKINGRVCDGGTLVNVSTGGDGGFTGGTLSEESRKKISQGNKGKTISAEQRAKISRSRKMLPKEVLTANGFKQKGRVHREESKIKMSKSHTGKTLSVEHRNSIGATLKGRLPSVNTRMAAVKSRLKKVLCISNGIVYDSVKDAAEKLGVHRPNVGHCCHGRLNSTGGHQFKFIDK